MHGFPDTAHTWRHLMPALAERGYRAVAPFLRGYAPTEVTDVFEVGALVADANALHEELGGDENAVIIGHDWGAYPVYGTTDRFRRSVALALPPTTWLLDHFFGYEQLKRSFYVFLFQTQLAETAAAMPGFLDGLWADWSPGYDATDDLAFLRTSLGDPANLAAAIGYYRAMLGTTPSTGRFSTEQAAANQGPDGPILYLHGGRDGCIGADLVRDVELPEGSHAEIIEDAGHFLHLERPDVVNARILDWLAK
ncbi:alpha/beta hydrolase [Nonomuraea sp. NBC_01738]|uniref:alpha/beta fold hydrolase n=1 Tax=Nonomuraea sp. NBC_01738 TaxID=2976003 RepID=UPI002E129F3D|nr:alpha/beta hydrolase [Nonomuraea sp. NBC_01738]